MHRLIVGLTGNIATGKSTVLRYLREKGAYVIDADKLTHQAMQPQGPAYAAIAATFGPAIVKNDGTIDRAALGRIVFSDPLKLRQLEEVVHPAVFVLAKEELAKTDAGVVVVEAIKLLESQRLLTLCKEVWVVTAAPEVQLRRLMSERGMTEGEARQRMAAQSSQEEKVRQATRVIANNGTPEELYRQLDALWNELAEAA
ncbi:MAG: dephospho-CoA kinase [Caldilineaceae bacterium]